MEENQNQPSKADGQTIDKTLREPSVGVMYDKDKDQTKVFSQNPDGSIGTVDPTPENEHLFFVMDKEILPNFYKNFQKYKNNPTINIYVVPRRALGRMTDALKRYWKKTTSDDVKLYYNYKLRPDGQFECRVKSRGIPISEMPWDTLNRMGYSFGGLEKANYLQRLQNYDQTGMHKLKYHDNVINYIGEGKFRLKKSGDRYKVDIKSYAHVLDNGLFDQKFNDQDMKNLEMYGNLGRVLETSEGPLLVSRDFDTRQLDYSNAENAFIPRYLRGTELKQDDIDGFRRGEIRNIAIVGRDGSVTVVPYQYNAVFRKPMELLTLEQRNALAGELRKQRDLERIISTSPEDSGERLQYPQTPKQSAEQAAETTTQGQATAPTPAPEPSQQTQTAEHAGQQQGPAPAPDLFGEGQQTQAPGAAKQGQATATASGQRQKPQGPEPGKEQKPAPRPQVKTPEPKAGQGKGKHL